MSTVLITGDQGFVGVWLRLSLESQGHEVHGFDLVTGNDVRDYEQIRTAVESTNPDYIYHLAAQSWPRESITDPRRAIDVNVTGALNLLDAVRNVGVQAKVLLAGTAEEYGYSSQPHGQPVTETSLCSPETPYGVSKLAQTQLGRVYAEKYNMHVVMTRAYNHTGFGQSSIYAAPAFAKRVVDVEAGRSTIVKHGDLSAIRNYTDVRDVVKAYTQVIEVEPGIYNICSDSSVPMQQVLDTLIELSDSEIPTELQTTLGWGGDTHYPLPSYEKLHAATGWTPTYTLEETLLDVLNFWRARENH